MQVNCATCGKPGNLYCSRKCYRTFQGSVEDCFRRVFAILPKDADCWEWPSISRSGGYGQIPGLGGNGSDYAHRVSYRLHHGPIPPGMVVRHTCDNPPCVKPDHLIVGTHADNAADKIARGRYSRHHVAIRGRVALIEEALSAHKMTQGEIAVTYGVSLSTVSRMARMSRRGAA